MPADGADSGDCGQVFRLIADSDSDWDPKSEALAQDGVLNPNPAAVRDVLFTGCCRGGWTARFWSPFWPRKDKAA
jgi:hypothetical protein